jgi:hypothetical protein
VNGVSLMRLIVLLAVLGLGLYGIARMGSAPAPVAQAKRDAPAPQAAPVGGEVARSDESQAVRGLPDSVRRLADQPLTGPSRPMILQEAAIDPAAVQPMQALRAATAAAVSTDQAGTIRRVTANSVNVRGGPSTQNAIVGRLTRGEEVEVLATDPSGWVQVRMQGDGIEGWVAGRLLAD